MEPHPSGRGVPDLGGVLMTESRRSVGRREGCCQASLSAASASKSIAWLWNWRSAWRHGALKNAR